MVELLSNVVDGDDSGGVLDLDPIDELGPRDHGLKSRRSVQGTPTPRCRLHQLEHHRQASHPAPAALRLGVPQPYRGERRLDRVGRAVDFPTDGGRRVNGLSDSLVLDR